MVSIHRAELPSEVAGMAMTEGADIVVIVNAHQAERGGAVWVDGLVADLLGRAVDEVTLKRAV